MTSGEVVYSISDYAKEFVREYKTKEISAKVVDAIIVDFVNYFAAIHCGIDLAFYTNDLRDEKKMSKVGVVLQKDIIVPTMVASKESYNRYGIIKSVNRNCHMNDCNGKAKADNKEALKLIDDFIIGYMEA